MTSNQVAYASNREEVRHNKIVESETNRHNIVMEELGQESNDIAKDKNQIQATYQSESLRIQEEYNKWYAKYMEANEDKKRQLEAEGNAIQQQLADTEAWYKQAMTDISSREASVKERNLKETQSWNTFVKGLEYDKLAQSYWWYNVQQDYNNRMLEEQSISWRGQLANKMFENEIAKERNELQGVNLIWDIKKYPFETEMKKRGQDLDFASNLFGSMLSLGSALLRAFK